jgi:hypothetical protein
MLVSILIGAILGGLLVVLAELLIVWVIIFKSR